MAKKTTLRTSNMAKVVLGIIVVAIIFILGGKMLPGTAKPVPVSINEVTSTGTVTLAFGQPSTPLAVNTATTIPVTIDTATTLVTAASVTITYDPTKVTVSSVAQGSFLPNTLAAATISSGTISFTYSVPAAAGSAKQGTGTVATLSVKPLSTGSFTLTFGTGTLVAAADAANNPLPGNVLKTANAVTYSTYLATDLNHDKKVDIFDYNLYLPDYGKTGAAGFTVADINRDGKVDIFDYNLFVSDYGKTTP